MMLAMACALAVPTIAFATSTHQKVASATDVRNNNPPTLIVPPTGILRQDLFDRRNPINLRSNWPTPPAQPGQL
ncbi:hypothetical protein [Bradyrhizobium sp.]|uniref:hypothetical protein n=1 Tax=Bradyrhizobium sp. TaxID=376 RepID=UPI003C3BDAC0